MKIEPIRPVITLEEASRLAEDLYGLAGKVQELPSERDRNFLVCSSSGDRFVLKIANVNEDRAGLEFQNEMLSRLAQSKASDSFPKVIASETGNDIDTITAISGNEHLVRLVTFLDGSPLAEVSHRSDVLLQSLGRLLGRMSAILDGFEHTAARREFHWDLSSARETIESLRSNISSPERQSILDHNLAQYDSIVHSELSGLRRSIIHNDANDHNVITRMVSIPETDLSLWVVTGIVDFGDAVESHTVNELAVALAYVMLKATDPIADACHVVDGYHRQWALTPSEQKVLFTLSCMRLCLSVSICALQQSLDPNNPYLRVTEQPAWNLLKTLQSVDPMVAIQRIRSACTQSSNKELTGVMDHGIESADNTVFFSQAKGEKSKIQIQEERQRLIGHSLSISYKQPLKIVRGYMQYLYDEEGKTYLDAVNNVPHVGHCHPHVVNAGQRQMAVLNTNTRYLHDNLTEFAARLTATMPEPLSVCFFVCSGTEANELAVRMARTHTGGSDFVVIDGAYHGNSSGMVDLSPYKFKGQGGMGCPSHVQVVPTPDTFRGLYKGTVKNPGEKYAAHLVKALEGIESAGHQVAGFIAEPIMGCAGQIVPPPGYLKRAFEHIRLVGGLCIADEVQIGFGRVGSHFWAFETQDVVPDIVTLGKPIGNGHPLAAVVTTPEIATSFDNGMEYFNTFGGNPVSCAIGMAVLDVIEEECLQDNAREVGKYLKHRLQALADRHLVIGDVRGLGLFLGVELVESRDTLEPDTALATDVVERMKDAGVLVSTDGPDENVIKIKPPLVFTRENADQLVEAMSTAIVSAGR